jgi:GT2 family glycosyltransferase
MRIGSRSGEPNQQDPDEMPFKCLRDTGRRPLRRFFGDLVGFARSRTPPRVPQVCRILSERGFGSISGHLERDRSGDGMATVLSVTSVLPWVRTGRVYCLQAGCGYRIRNSKLDFVAPRPKWEKIMTDCPTISVVTVAQNAASTIRHCVESVKNQLHPVQHVIVDLGSNDGTHELARKHALPGALIVSAPGNGPYAAMNKGLAMATGEVVGGLNAESLYPHNRVLSVIAKEFSDPGLQACYGDLVWVDPFDLSKIIRYCKSRTFDERLFYRGWLPPHPTLFVRRHLYEKYGWINTKFGPAADYELVLRLLLRYKIRTKYVPEILVVMRSGGLGHFNLLRCMKASRMDGKAWRENDFRPKPWTIIGKALPKVSQYLFKKVPGKPWMDHGWPQEIEGAGTEKGTSETLTSSPVGRCPTNSGARIPLYVVTVNYHSDQSLIGLLESLRSVDDLAKVIVVNHSMPAPLNTGKYNFAIESVTQENRGYGAGLNRGLRLISEPSAVALLCNPDVKVLDPKGLKEAIDYLARNDRIGCLAPRLVNAEHEPLHSVREFYNLKTLIGCRIPWLREKMPRFLSDHFYEGIDGTEPLEVDWGSGSAMLIKTSLFPYPISFDERFFLYFEDVDLCARIWKHGFSVVFYPNMLLMHEEQKKSHKNSYFLQLHIQSLIRFIIRYRGLPRRDQLTPSAVQRDENCG